MLKSGCRTLRLALCIATGLASSACAVEEDGPLDESTVEEVRALTASDSTRKWYPVTGFLMDIATGNGAGSRWGIDTNPGPGGFRVVKWSGSQWAATNGRGVRIALKGTGAANTFVSDVFVPWVVTSDGHIIRATSSAGNAWVGVPDLPGGVTAVDIGSGPPAADMRMWAVGNDGRVYELTNGAWGYYPDGPVNAIRVSGPVYGRENQTNQVFVLTSLGEVWAYIQSPAWVKVGSVTDNLRNDVSAGESLDFYFSERFLTSIMVTSSKAVVSNYVQTLDPSPFGGEFVWTGLYAAQLPGWQIPIPAPPMAVSSDVDRHRAWIVTTDHRVYYGE